MKWVPARDVLKGEATHFTPWLSQNLDLLAAELGLDDLTLVATETAAAEKRLDILATATDEDGSEFPVIIENQYDVTDHKHLGQIITYLAQQGHGLAVWVVERASEAHIAAIDFLNRTTVEGVGYVLTRVRFTPGADGTYQVTFETLARPNSFLRASRRRTTTDQTRVKPEKMAYLTAIIDEIRDQLIGAGLKNINMHTYGAYVEMRFPSESELDNYTTRLKIKVTQTQCSVGLHISGFDTREENEAALDVLRDQYQEALSGALPPGTGPLDWHAGTRGADSDFVKAALDGQGYKNGDAATAADWASRVCLAWAAVVATDPMNDLAAKVEDKAVREDAEHISLD